METLEAIYFGSALFVLIQFYDMFDEFPGITIGEDEYDISKWLWLASAILWPFWLGALIGTGIYMGVPKLYAWIKGKLT